MMPSPSAIVSETKLSVYDRYPGLTGRMLQNQVFKDWAVFIICLSTVWPTEKHVPRNELNM
jgi:hypothetical protein